METMSEVLEQESLDCHAVDIGIDLNNEWWF